MKPKNDGSEFICPDCNGKGSDRLPLIESTIVKECEKCGGKGKLDWIEKAVGKKEEDLIDYLNKHPIDVDLLGDIGCH